ncbi:MAG: hypothetical protein ACHRXM_02040 [Isosphaerales bacterium]
MRLPHVRFTIRSLMIAVAIVAGLLSLPTGWAVIVIALSLPCLALIGARWLVLRGYRRVSAFGFCVFATLINVLYAASCIAPDVYVFIPFFLGLVIVGPTIGGIGAAWATLATREGAVPRRSPLAAWWSVIAVSVTPLVTLWTLWPLHLAFAAVGKWNG